MVKSVAYTHLAVGLIELPVSLPMSCCHVQVRPLGAMSQAAASLAAGMQALQLHFCHALA